MTNASWTYHPAIVTQKNVIRIVSNRTDATLYRTYVTQTSTTNIIFSLGIFFPSQVPLLLIDATFPRKFLKMLWNVCIKADSSDNSCKNFHNHNFFFLIFISEKQIYFSYRIIWNRRSIFSGFLQIMFCSLSYTHQT